MLPDRIFLAGRRGAGKSTLAQSLAARGYLVTNMTDPIYDIARRYFDMTHKDRDLLQRIGDAFRQVDGEWLLRRVAALPAPVVVESVRLPYEAEYLTAHGYVGVLVEAPEPLRLARLLARDGVREDAAVDAHQTETLVDRVPVALRLVNTGSPEDLLIALERQYASC